MIKLIYLARRKPDFTHDDFTRRWRMHGARGMSTVFWRHALAYTQAEPIRPAPLAGASSEYDAIAYLILKEDAFNGPFSQEDIDSSTFLLADELETFSAPIPTVALWVNEEKLKPGALGGITAFLFFKDAAKARQLAGIFQAEPLLNRVTLNTRRDDTVMGPTANTLPYAAILELSASSIANLQTVATKTSALQQSDVAVVTREAVFWDRLPS